MDELRFMIVAGEASGDGHGAKLVRAIRELGGERIMEFFGGAGPQLREAGVEAIVKTDELSIVGLPEIAKALPLFLRAFRDLKRAAADRKPDAVILIDFPEFNLKLAKSLKKAGFTIVYYISPQLWAWRKYRLAAIKKYVDLIITILPFEKDWYERRGVSHVEYVGSPLAMEVHPNISRNEFCQKHGFDIDARIISLLPGSRHKEVVRILPVMLGSAEIVRTGLPNTQFVVAAVPTVIDETKQIVESERKWSGSFTIVSDETYDALYASDAAAVTSGTATLEAGIIGVPMAIVYKTSAFNYRLFEPMISVDHYGLINLIAGERVGKELIQHEFTAASLADELLCLMEPATNADMRDKLQAVTEKLGHGGASKRAAQSIFKLLGVTDLSFN
jgi:lipid-A-disaccharide synthase